MDELFTMAPEPCLQLVFHAHPHAFEIDGSHPIKLFATGVCCLNGRALHTRVIERGIQPSEVGNSPVDHFPNLLLICYVAANGYRLVSFFCEIPCGLSYESFIAIGKRDCRAPT